MCVLTTELCRYLFSCLVLLTFLKACGAQGYYNYNNNPYNRQARAYSSYNAATNAAAARLKQLQSQSANTNRLQNYYAYNAQRNNGYNPYGTPAIAANRNYYARQLNYYNRNAYTYPPYGVASQTTTTTRSPNRNTIKAQDLYLNGYNNYATQVSPVRRNYPSSYDYRNSPYGVATTTSSPVNHGRNATKNRDEADVENSKFAGASNQEDVDESGRVLLKLKKHLKRKRILSSNSGTCLPFGRDAATAGSTAGEQKGQERFLWDVNIYNVYGGGCRGGYGGGGLGGGLLGGLFSDPYPTQTPFNAFLSLLRPGVFANSLAATARPPLFNPQADPTNGIGQPGTGAGGINPGINQNYGPQAPPPLQRPPGPNQVYFDSPGAAPITPGQLVGGVATTINGIIQQLTGNVQPVYPPAIG